MAEEERKRKIRKLGHLATEKPVSEKLGVQSSLEASPFSHVDSNHHGVPRLQLCPEHRLGKGTRGTTVLLPTFLKPSREPCGNTLLPPGARRLRAEGFSSPLSPAPQGMHARRQQQGAPSGGWLYIFVPDSLPDVQSSLPHKNKGS